MSKKWFQRILETYQQLLDTKNNRTLDEEEIILYHNLCKLINTWTILQETGFEMQQYEANQELKRLKTEFGIKDDEDDDTVGESV